MLRHWLHAFAVKILANETKGIRPSTRQVASEFQNRRWCLKPSQTPSILQAKRTPGFECRATVCASTLMSPLESSQHLRVAVFTAAPLLRVSNRFDCRSVLTIRFGMLCVEHSGGAAWAD